MCDFVVVIVPIDDDDDLLNGCFFIKQVKTGWNKLLILHGEVDCAYCPKISGTINFFVTFVLLSATSLFLIFFGCDTSHKTTNWFFEFVIPFLNLRKKSFLPF